MSDWYSRPLGDLITLQRGFDITRDQQARDGAVPVVSSGGISSYHDRAMANGPGVVIGRKGTLGRVHFVDVPYWPHDTTLWVKDFNGNYPKFVYYALMMLDTEFLNVGSASPTLNRNHLYPLPVSWPTLPEQEAIAEVLGALDDKIAANTRTVDAARHLIRARVSVAGTSCALRDVAILNKSSVNPQSMSAPTVAHFSLPAFDEGAWPEIVVPSQIKSNKFMVPGPAVLLSKLNPRIPRVWDVVGPPENSLASTEFLVLTSEVPSTALWGAISQPATQVELASKVAGTSGSHQRVRPEEVMDLRIPDPRSLSQNVLAAIDGLGRCVWSLQAESQSLVRTRDELLPLLMSGKVRVKDAEKVVEGVV
jgi:type I restriction enzyme S subunit